MRVRKPCLRERRRLFGWNVFLPFAMVELLMCGLRRPPRVDRRQRQYVHFNMSAAPDQMTSRRRAQSTHVYGGPGMPEPLPQPDVRCRERSQSTSPDVLGPALAGWSALSGDVTDALRVREVDNREQIDPRDRGTVRNGCPRNDNHVIRRICPLRTAPTPRRRRATGPLPTCPSGTKSQVGSRARTATAPRDHPHDRRPELVRAADYSVHSQKRRLWITQ